LRDCFDSRGIGDRIAADTAALVDTQHLVPIGRLQDAQRRLEVEALGDHEQFAHGPLQVEDLEPVPGAQDREGLRTPAPEHGVVDQCLERREHGTYIALRIALCERSLERTQLVAVANRIAFAIRMMTMRRQVQGDAWWFRLRDEGREVPSGDLPHGRC
jgi:hypothetical protein